MNIQINTANKTIIIIDLTKIEELLEFITKFQLGDYSIISNTTYCYNYSPYPSFKDYDPKDYVLYANPSYTVK